MAYFLYLAAFLAVAGIGCWLQNRWRLPGRLLMVAGGCGCIGLIIWQTRSAVSSAPAPLQDSYYATAAYALGQQVARELRDQRGQVVLIYPPASEMDAKTRDALTYVFARVLQAAPSLTLRVTELTPLDGDRKSGRPSPADWERILSPATEDLAYVFFAGTPRGIETLPSFQRDNRPGVFVFDSHGSTDWVPALKQGVIRRVIVPRPETRPTEGQVIEGRPEEIFQRYFLLATPATAQQIAAQLKP